MGAGSADKSQSDISTLADGITASGLQRVSRAGIDDVGGSEGLLRGVYSGLGEVKCTVHDLISVSVVRPTSWE